MTHTDVVIVGGGIVGLATALKLQSRYPNLRLRVIEAESNVGKHQSGHNSGVLHSGIYYKPGSKKATCCRAGKQEMEEFCTEHSIAWDKCGKVIVATSEVELSRLDNIAERARFNGVNCERINSDQLRELEPAAAGISALHVPETGIVNYRSVCLKMAQVLRAGGATIELDFELIEIRQLTNSLELKSSSGQKLQCGNLINCGGLQSDRVCKMAGVKTELKVVPFRGEYYELAPNSESLCRNLIYPVPDPSFPFLGVHFTRMIDGGVECGPNAVLALARDGYRWRDISITDLADTIAFSGFRKLAAKHWRMGFGEVHRSISKQAFVTALQKLIPSIKSNDLMTGRAGVRAQTVTPEGELVDDFLFEVSEHAVHVLNAPSPAATASLAIADHIVDRFADQFA
ncbi:L-2-hydroxyglutarate oxidase [Rubripirellula sp.]|jgi:(S)-2-hydroxyglutarate dehydrogenase|nr:L-2-hydroxyglutarate oxidase [Rubripirellula sp.]MDB4749697.1 L-2-hydroxyglutarate oxidase [Rubripirellula sp.]